MLPFEKTGIKIPKILIPNQKVSLKKWAVIACDQFTSQEDYWHDVERIVGGAPSTLHIILPEVYLENDNVSEIIEQNNKVMKDYLTQGVLEELPEGLLLVERQIGDRVRKGVMVAVDLEKYDFDPEAKAQIRATEKTVLERIPPRVQIRKGAILETPHIMVMMDDPDNSAIGQLELHKTELHKIYDFDLMKNGGNIKGYFTDNQVIIENFKEAICNLNVQDGMVFCVGDGNHSLATAKTVWEEKKMLMTPEEQEVSPLRYALVELVNVRDEGIAFKPIHRILFKVNPTTCLDFIVKRMNDKGLEARLIYSRFRYKSSSEVDCGGEIHVIPFVSKDGSGRIEVANSKDALAISDLQDILDEFLAENPTSSIDYIHGDDAFFELATDYDNLGFFMGALNKSEFFETVINCGVLPKKTFSMGEAEEKRYYLECRYIGMEPLQQEQGETEPETAEDQDIKEQQEDLETE